MKSRHFLFRGLVALSLVLLAWVCWRQFGSPSSPTAGGETEAANESPSKEPIQLPPATPSDSVTVSARPPAMATPAETAATPAWQESLDEILRSSAPEAGKAEELLKLALTPGLDAEAQAEVMQHAVNLLPDDRFTALKETIVNPQTPESVLDVLTTDLLNRPNSIKLPLILEIAKTPGHPKIEEAMSLLQVFLEEDYGEDWPRWEAAMQKWLSENPDDPQDPTAAPPPQN